VSGVKTNNWLEIGNIFDCLLNERKRQRGLLQWPQNCCHCWGGGW